MPAPEWIDQVGEIAPSSLAQTMWRVSDGSPIRCRTRAVSDGVNFAYLADVYVEAVARGAGLGTAIVRAMVEDGPGRAFRWTLFTNDAHGLYARFGFAAPDATAMVRPALEGPANEGSARL